MNARRFIVTLYALVFVALLTTSGVFFWQTREEYKRLQELERKSQKRLAELETKLSEQQRILERLRTDPAYVERVIRRELKYVRPDEMVFRFDQ